MALGPEWVFSLTAYLEQKERSQRELTETALCYRSAPERAMLTDVIRAAPLQVFAEVTYPLAHILFWLCFGAVLP